MVEIHEVEAHPGLRARTDRHLASTPSQCGKAFFKHGATNHIEDHFRAACVRHGSHSDREVSSFKVDPLVDREEPGCGNVRSLSGGADHASTEPVGDTSRG